jgi:FkbM family methyltransferase
MDWVLRLASNFRHFNMLRDAWGSASQFPGFPSGTIFPMRCRLRKALASKYSIGCYVRSASGAWHFLSPDTIDEVVLRGMLGRYAHAYFPTLPESIINELNSEGLVLDVGGFNGFWTAEMLVRCPGARALLLEPNLDKCKSIPKTLKASGVITRTRTIQAALASEEGRGWLMRSEEGSWGDWVQSDPPGKSSDANQVSTITLARALDELQPVIVKCNAEGGEFELVRQVLDLGLRPKLMILFIHPERGDVNKLWSELSRAGYTPNVVDDYPTHPCWHVKLI